MKPSLTKYTSVLLVTALALSACHDSKNEDTASDAGPKTMTSTVVTSANDHNSNPLTKNKNTDPTQQAQTLAATLLSFGLEFDKALKANPDLIVYVPVTSESVNKEALTWQEEHGTDGYIGLVPSELAGDNNKLHKFASVLKDLPSFALVDTTGASDLDVVNTGLLLNRLQTEWTRIMLQRGLDKTPLSEQEKQGYEHTDNQIIKPEFVSDPDSTSNEIIAVAKDPVFAPAIALIKANWDKEKDTWTSDASPYVMLTFTKNDEGKWKALEAKGMTDALQAATGVTALETIHRINEQIIAELTRGVQAQ